MRRNTKFSNILFINKSPYARSFYRLLNDLNVIKIATLTKYLSFAIRRIESVQ